MLNIENQHGNMTSPPSFLNIRRHSFWVLGACLLGCNNKPNQYTLLPKATDSTISSQTTNSSSIRSLVKNYGPHDNNQLFVFVGKKVSVELLPRQLSGFDIGVRAQYAVVDKVYGDFSADTIEFIAFDHHQIPNFSKFDHALLFVSADSGTYFQQKYLYNDVYMTKSNKWAGTYAASDYGHENNKRTRIKPVKIQFTRPVAYPKKLIRPDSTLVTIDYPTPYFKTRGDSAYAVYGNYVNELFMLKRNGVLRARGLFGPGKNNL